MHLLRARDMAQMPAFRAGVRPTFAEPGVQRAGQRAPRSLQGRAVSTQLERSLQCEIRYRGRSLLRPEVVAIPAPEAAE